MNSAPNRRMSSVEIKRAVRERDGHRCTKCGMTNEEHIHEFGRSLDVHRTTPGSGYSLDDGVCVTLCRPCHGPEPKRKHGRGTTVNLIPEEVAVIDALIPILRREFSCRYRKCDVVHKALMDLAKRYNVQPRRS